MDNRVLKTLSSYTSSIQSESKVNDFFMKKSIEILTQNFAISSWKNNQDSSSAERSKIGKRIQI
jgi:hypothetical protein